MKTKIAKNLFQQGDIIGRRLTKMPAGESTSLARSKMVVAHGESGHSHVIEDEDSELIQIGEMMILKLKNQATLVHEEHQAITLEPGIWEIGRVQEYDWFQKMQRAVMD